MGSINSENSSLYKQLSKLSKTGWWKILPGGFDLYISSFIRDLLGIKEEVISRERFRAFIKKDYTPCLNLDSLLVFKPGEYEKIYLLSVPQGEVFVRFFFEIESEIDVKEDMEEILGIMQVVKSPMINESSKILTEILNTEEIFKSIFNHTPIGKELYDKNGICYNNNPANMKIFGIEHLSDVIGLNLFDNPSFTDDIRQKIKNKETFSFRRSFFFDEIQKIHYYKTARVGRIELSTEVVPLYNYTKEFFGWLLINMDMTDNVVSNERLQNYNILETAISDYSHIGFGRYNLTTKECFVNQQWMLNQGEQDVTKEVDVWNLFAKIHPDFRKDIFSYYHDLSNNNLHSYQNIIPVRRPGTEDDWNYIQEFVIAMNSEMTNNQTQLICLNYDVTRFIETEEKLKEAHKKLEAEDQIKESIIHRISYGIRTPLNAISGFSSLIMDSDDPEDRRKYWNIVEENKTLLLSMVTDLLDISRLESGKMKPKYKFVDLKWEMERLSNLVTCRTKPGVIFYLDDCPECEIKTDKNYLNSILSKLVSNAIKFTLEGEIHGGYLLKESCVEFYIQDTGKGIAPDVIDNIFDDFFKADHFEDGAGLGLSICKKMIRDLNGRIGVTSELGVGSRFWFTLPYE